MLVALCWHSAPPTQTGRGNVMLTANLGYNISTQSGTENYLSASLGIGFPVTSSRGDRP